MQQGVSVTQMKTDSTSSSFDNTLINAEETFLKIF